MSKDFIFTSESVTEGHPDKICDQISDAVLDACLLQDAESKVACEVICTKNLIIISGEISTKAQINFEKIAKLVVKEIGYDDIKKGLDYNSLSVIVLVNEQSADIAQGVNENEGLHKVQGAGDQGLMFGYATDETDVLMPMPIYCAHILAKALADFRKNKIIPYLCPDGKTQVTIAYENNIPKRIDTVVISAQHQEGIEWSKIRKDLIDMARHVLPAKLLDNKTIFHTNPTGRFVIGGPSSDCGLTGRKIIVDSYGGMGRHGGGAFSGKDSSKVDRSAAYAARFVAKNIVAAGLAKECELQLAYAIGYDQPVSVNINTFNTTKIEDKIIENLVKTNFPLSTKWIVETLDLKKPIFKKTAAYGHFGRNENEFSWEKLDLIETIKQNISQKTYS